MARRLLGLLLASAVTALVAEAEAEPDPAPPERGQALLVCRTALWRRWSSGMEEVQAMVNSSLQDPKSYEKAARQLAEKQMAACSREATAADVHALRSGGLGDAAVERLLAASLGPDLSAEDRELYDKALAGEASNSEAPSIMGVQVHRVPLALQLLYMVGVVAAVSYVVFLVVRQLTARDKAKAEKAEEKKREKVSKKK
mmetsp:Transcript_70025/g.167268  ORF Transcript_70025/g.167268 Transcript_70025/m.167268 type:complete len:200 (+) Transcript_70025:56-655(+)